MALSQAYLEWEQQTEQRGIQQGELAIVTRQLTRRIGSIAPDIETIIRNLSLVQLESLGEALLDFSETADLITWLEQNRSN